MRYVLDTNICVYWLKGIMGIDKKLFAIDIDNIFVSSITIAELLYGSYNSAKVDENLEKVYAFEAAIKTFEIDRQCLEVYARIKAGLKAEGKIIDDFDILIASTAIVNDCILVTNNTKHFERINGLVIENWIS